MTTGHRLRRRDRYSSRAHDVETRMAQPAVTTAVPDDPAWKVRPGDTISHAFSTGPGWMRSACRQERWNVVLRDAGDVPHCFECHDLVTGQIPELEQRAMDGDR